MRSLATMAMVELQQIVRTDPLLRALAWEEIMFRNRARQAFEVENGYRTSQGAAVVRWLAPDLTPPPPLVEGPLKD